MPARTFRSPVRSTGETAIRRQWASRGKQLFDLLHGHRRDVLVLDLSKTNGRGIEAIVKIRERSNVPVLVVCSPADPIQPDYRLAGAVACMPAPIDIIELNRTILRIISVTGLAKPVRKTGSFRFAGIVFRADETLLLGAGAAAVKPTTSENDSLTLLVSRARTVCSREDIATVLYGRQHRPNSNRAIDIIVNRLRKKLLGAGGKSAEAVVKTEFRRGYVLVADVVAEEAGDDQAAPMRSVA